MNKSTTGAAKAATAKKKPATRKAVAKKPAAPRAAAKVAAAKKPAPAAKPSKPPQVSAPAAKAPGKKKDAGKKRKTVRDSFNMPADDYALIDQLKSRALAAAKSVKKSELLRAGLRMLSALSDEALKRALDILPAVKTGRPNKKRGG